MTVNLIKKSKGKRIKNSKGDLIKFLSNQNLLFKRFGEIYFSEIKKNKTKGWNYHKRFTCVLFVPSGKVKFLVYNPLLNKTNKIILSDKNLKILQIPPKNWFNFKSLAKKSIVTNILSGIHDKNETKKTNIIQNIKIK